jgi:DNA-binding NtrC family response regulator
MSLRPRVLLVEDDELVSYTLREILDEDYEISCVATAEQALAEIAGHRIDVVLLDYRLSDGNGQRVAESSTEASMPVIWMTGDPEAVRGVLGGSHRLLAKPFGVSVLRRTLADALACR